MWALNFVTAASNFTALWPLQRAWAVRDYLTLCVLAGVTTASVVSHLIENHKHGMTGVASLTCVAPHASYIANRADVVMCGATIARFGYLLVRSPVGLTSNQSVILPFLLALNLMSEYDKTIHTRHIYVALHSLWHMSIFIWMDSFLARVVDHKFNLFVE